MNVEKNWRNNSSIVHYEQKVGRWIMSQAFLKTKLKIFTRWSGRMLDLVKFDKDIEG